MRSTWSGEKHGGEGYHGRHEGGGQLPLVELPPVDVPEELVPLDLGHARRPAAEALGDVAVQQLVGMSSMGAMGGDLRLWQPGL